MHSENLRNELSEVKIITVGAADAATCADQEIVQRKRVMFSTPKAPIEKSLTVTESVKKSNGNNTHRQECTAESSEFSAKELNFEGCSSAPYGHFLKNSAHELDKTFKPKKITDT